MTCRSASAQRERLRSPDAPALLQPLESRQLLSLSPAGGEFRVNTYTTNSQTTPVVGVDGTGRFVAAWASYAQDGSTDGIYAQRYAADGTALGAEFRVNTTTTGQQQKPAIAVNASGAFVVCWQSPDSDSTGIFAQRYNASGVAQGGEFRVNATQTGAQTVPSIAIDDAGDFAVAWQSADLSAFGDTYIQRYNAAGVAQGGVIRPSLDQPKFAIATDPAIAMDAAGNIVVAWKGGSFTGIQVARYDAQGATRSTAAPVNTPLSTNVTHPALGVDAGGNFVVAWEEPSTDGSFQGVYARRYSAAGAALAPQFRVNTTTLNSQVYPSVAVNATDGFLIAWYDYNQSIQGNTAEVFAQQYAPDGTPRNGEFRVNTTALDNQLDPAVALSPGGAAVVVWQSFFQDGDLYGIYAQRYTRVPDPASLDGIVWLEQNANDHRDAGEPGQPGVAVRLVTDAGNATVASTVTGADGAYHLTGIPGGVTAHLEVVAPTGMVFARADRGGDDARDSDVNPATGRSASFTLAAGTASAGPDAAVETPVTVSGVAFQDADADAAPDPGETRLPGWTVYADDNDNDALDPGEWAAVTAADGSYTLPPLPAGNFHVRLRRQINWFGFAPRQITSLPGQALTNVNFGIDNHAPVTQFTPSSPAAGPGISTPDSVFDPDVAVNRSGASVVVWQDTIFYPDGRDDGEIRARRFDASGAPVGNVIAVNTFRHNPDVPQIDLQLTPAVAIDDAGNFVVVWSSDGQDGSFDGVYAQRFDAAGNPRGGEFRVNTTTLYTQWAPSVAMDAAGNFTVAWLGGSGAGWQVDIQRYAANGTPLGGETPVGDPYPSSEDIAPALAMNAAGAGVVSWIATRNETDRLGDNANWDYLYASRFDASGAFQAAPSLVETSHHYLDLGRGFIQNPNAAVDDAGDYVITWGALGADLDYDMDIRAQRFDAAGVPQGEIFRVNTYDVGDQHYPDVAADAAGNFIISYDDSEREKVYARRYTAAGVPTGPEFTPDNSQISGAGSSNSVAMTPAGTFVLTWRFNGLTHQRFNARVAVADVVDPAPTTRKTPVDSVDVLLSEPINLSTFTRADLALTRDGQPVPLDNSVTIAAISGGGYRYRITGLTPFTTPDGAYALTVNPAAVNDAEGLAGAGAASAAWTVDATPPTVSAAQYDWRTGYVLKLTFSEDLGPEPARGAVVARPQAGGPDLQPTAYAYDPATRTATFTFTALPDGDYTARLTTSGIADPAGNAMAGPTWTMSFFALAADLNRDRIVDFNDLVVLAQNYNTTGRKFDEGDFNYDGTVDFNDLVLLAQRYNTGLSAAAPQAVASALPASFALPAASPQKKPNPLFSAAPVTKPTAAAAKPTGAKPPAAPPVHPPAPKRRR